VRIEGEFVLADDEVDIGDDAAVDSVGELHEGTSSEEDDQFAPKAGETSNSIHGDPVPTPPALRDVRGVLFSASLPLPPLTLPILSKSLPNEDLVDADWLSLSIEGFK
jgi:hypothetical protein